MKLEILDLNSEQASWLRICISVLNVPSPQKHSIHHIQTYPFHYTTTYCPLVGPMRIGTVIIIPYAHARGPTRIGNVITLYMLFSQGSHEIIGTVITLMLLLEGSHGDRCCSYRTLSHMNTYTSPVYTLSTPSDICIHTSLMYTLLLSQAQPHPSPSQALDTYPKRHSLLRYNLIPRLFLICGKRK